MNVIALFFAASFAFAVAGPASAAADVHSQESAGLRALKLNAGKKWETDAPLRKGMSEIRDAFARDKDAIHAGKMSAQRYAALAKTIDTQVAYMVANCKLPPEADAQLHLIIAELMQASSAMQGKDKKVPARAGAEKAAAAIAAYGRHFDHPGWKPLA